MTTLRLLTPGETAASVLFPAFEEAYRADRRVWYLVPGSRERRIRLRQLAGRMPLLNPPVGTLEDLAYAALRRAGRPVPLPPDPRLVELLLRDALAGTWPGVASGPGLEGAARRSIRALLDDGWTCETLNAALERVGDRYGSGKRLQALWAAFHALCGEADVAAPLREALAGGLLAQGPPELLLIEGGPAPGELRARLLSQLIGATREAGGEIIATAVGGPDGTGPLARGRELLLDLLGGRAASVPCDVHPTPALAHLARNLFRTDGGCDSYEDVIRLTAPDACGTADLIAREIRALLRDSDSPAALMAEGVAVVCPTAADREMAERALRQHGLPVAVTPHEPMAAHPGGRFLLGLLDVLRHGAETPAETVLELLASDGWGLPPTAADRLARLLRLRGAVTAGHVVDMLGAMEGRAAARSRQRLERLFALKREFERTRSSAERSGLVNGILRRKWARDREHWVVDPRRGAWRRHGASGLLAGHVLTPAVRGAAGYARPMRKLEDLLAALDERARRTGRDDSPGEWLATLRELLAGTLLQIGSEPALGVRLDSPGAIEPAAVVFVLGLVERRFPRGPGQDAFLPDALRSALAEGFLLPPALSADGPDAERERFLLACSAARQRLYLCHPRTDGDGREVLPSFFLEDVARCLGLENADALPQRRRRIGEVIPDPRDCASVAEFRARVSMALRDPELSDAERAELCRAIDGLASRDAGFRYALLARFSDWRAEVTDAENRRYLAERAERLSASQLGTYAHCGFRHFVDRRLDARPIQLPVFDAARRGSAVHDLLWSFGAEWNGWTDPEPALRMIESADLEGSAPSILASHRSRAGWSAWRQRLQDFLRGEHARVLASAFRPDYHELTFGDREGHRDPRSRDEPVALAFGDHTIRFSGSVDRIDTLREGGATYGVALDYKTGKVDRYRKAIETGDELQLLLYLRMLEAVGIHPAGALYLSVANDELAGVVHERFADAVGPVGKNVIIADDERWNQLRRQADERILELQLSMKKPEITAKPREWNCWPCELQGLCRVHLWRARQHA